MELQEDIVKINPLLLIPYWKMGLCAGAGMVSVGINLFWNVPINWLELLSVITFCELCLVTANWLSILYAYNHTETKHRQPFKFLADPFGKITEISANLDVSPLVFSILIGACTSVLLITMTISIAPFVKIAAVLFSITFAFCYAYGGMLENFKYVFEVSDGFFCVLLPSLLIGSLSRSNDVLLYAAGFATPLFFIFLTLSFAMAMDSNQKNLSYKPGIFNTLVEKGNLRFFYVLVFLQYVSLVFYSQAGIQWRMLRYGLLLIPCAIAQIVSIEKMLAGEMKVSDFLCRLTFFTVALSIYFGIITFWFFA